MPLRISNLTITVTIGGKEIILDSDTIDRALDSNPQEKIDQLIEKGFSFKMRQGTSVRVNVGELVGWFEAKFDKSGEPNGTNYVNGFGDDVRGFVNQAANDASDSTVPTGPDLTALDGIEIELSDLYFNALKSGSAPLKLTFGFTIVFRLDQNFYNGLGLAPLNGIFTVDEVGFSLKYTNNTN
jgi:hypothetical protein